jgi:hypothetical protein
MKFSEYWSGLTSTQKLDFAARVSRKKPYLDHLAAGRKEPGPELAVAIQIASSCAVDVYELLPGRAIFIWPPDVWVLKVRV